MYILEGPASCGNVFGYWREDSIPAGKFAVVQRGELTNGGRGPIQVHRELYDSREESEAALAQIGAAK